MSLLSDVGGSARRRKRALAIKHLRAGNTISRARAPRNLKPEALVVAKKALEREEESKLSAPSRRRCRRRRGTFFLARDMHSALLMLMHYRYYSRLSPVLASRLYMRTLYTLW